MAFTDLAHVNRMDGWIDGVHLSISFLRRTVESSVDVDLES